MDKRELIYWGIFLAIFIIGGFNTEHIFPQYEDKEPYDGPMPFGSDTTSF